jgi:hypothetical protein
MQPMRRVESVGYSGKYRNRSLRSFGGDGEGTGVKRLALFLVVAGLAWPLIPQLGSLTWILSWVVLPVLFIASIIIMTKGAFFRGCLGILFALIVLPVWAAVASMVILVAKDERGWKQALLEEMKKHEISQKWISVLESAGTPEGTNGGTVLSGPESGVGGIETITSKDGRTIRGTIEAYEAWGVTMKREDGQIVNVTFELMSAGDMQKFRDRYNSQQR